MESLADNLATMVRTPLGDAHVERIRRIGREVPFAAGETFMELGAPMDKFFYLLDGEAEAVDPVTGGRYGGGATLGPGQFAGEISFLTGGRSMLPMRAVRDSTFLVADRARMLELMAQVPELSDIVVTVMAARRRRLLESNEASLTLIGMDRDRDCAIAARNRIPLRSTSATRRRARSRRSARSCRGSPPFSSVATTSSRTLRRARSHGSSGWISTSTTRTSSTTS